jgi:phospholipid/cholesterol/gamma-HCH transport system substrate-binding protein
MMKKLSDLFKEDPVHGSVGDNMRVTMANLKRITDSLNAALGNQEEALTETVANMRDISQNIRRISANLDEIIGDHKGDIRTALEKIRSISERLDSLLAKVQSGEGTMGKLISDEQMGEDLKATFTDVRQAAKEAQAILGRIALIDVYWDYRHRYDFEDERNRIDLGLRIVPRKGKYYFVQGNNLGARRDRRDPGNDIERRNTVTAVMGHDFGPLTLYGGVIRSAGGAGLRFRPLFMSEKWNRRFELEGEAYNFTRDEVVQGIAMEGPIYNAGARFLIDDPWLWLGAQVEDIKERKNLNANVNITFKDEDIAYLLGFVGLAR